MSESYRAPHQPRIPYALLAEESEEERLISIEALAQDQVFGFRVRNMARIQKAKGGDDAVTLRCPVCFSALQVHSKKLKMGGDHVLYFSHAPNTAKDCGLAREPGLARGVIEALIYDGVRESEKHRKLKEWVAKLVHISPGLELESLDTRYVTGVGKDGRKHRRKPDVLLEKGGKRVAIELQVSPLFTQVIADRHVAYSELDIPLVWVAENFTPGRESAFHKDITEQNGGFIFSLDDQVRSLSEEKGRLFLRMWRRLYLHHRDGYFWKQALVELSDLDLHLLQSGSEQYFDVQAGLSVGMLAQIEERIIEDNEPGEFDYGIYHSRLESLGIGDVDSYHSLIKILLSIRDGRVYSRQSWKWLANQALNHQAEHIRLIAYAAKTYDRDADLFPKESKQYERLSDLWSGARSSVSEPMAKLLLALLPELKPLKAKVFSPNEAG